MAQFVFNVARKGQDKIECIATVPSKVDLPGFKGGKILVKTPKGDREVELTPAIDMILDALTVQLQNGVRDFLFPKTDGEAQTKTSTKRRGYVG